MRETGLVLLTLSITLGSLEVGLTALSMASPAIDELLGRPLAISQELPDSRLGNRGNPDAPGHDIRGFRNPDPLSRADIVGLGDSQTYGSGVEPRDAWPSQLASMSVGSVYSMAFGGYGPVHSLALWDEAMALRPGVVIEGFYSGNDLYDAFKMVYSTGVFPELASAAPSTRIAVESAEDAAPIGATMARMFGASRSNSDRPTRRPFFGRSFLSERSKLYGLVRRTRYAVQVYSADDRTDPAVEWEDARRIADESPFSETFERGQYRTIFTPEYRLAALNLADPRIFEGLQISLTAIRQMNSLAAANGIRFLVLLIPTKELVFKDLVQDPSAEYRSLIENEEEMWRLTLDSLGAHGIEYVDALPALSALFTKGNQPYPATSDGHPNAQGHRAMAELIRGRLSGRQ